MDDINSFLGTGWSFPPQFSKTEKTVKMIADEEDIKNSLEVLLATRVGERLMQPDYGCNLDVLLFEPIDVTLQTYIKDLVFTAIYFYEPRVKPDDVILSVPGQEGIILIEVQYTIRATNTRHNMVYPFYLEEGTLLK
ncbi:MAG TPA: GPW/gp25 family protein [Bacteroidales bacterium]|nr:GPW/gp25 family protein [Bacteroidales bacterium]